MVWQQQTECVDRGAAGSLNDQDRDTAVDGNRGLVVLLAAIKQQQAVLRRHAMGCVAHKHPCAVSCCAVWHSVVPCDAEPAAGEEAAAEEAVEEAKVGWRLLLVVVKCCSFVH